MTNEERVAAIEFCQSHNVEISFLYSLGESGLLEIATVEEKVFINREQLSALERMIRLHYEMDINLEGIEAIHHLLQQLEAMQEEAKHLRKRLNLYEKY